MTARHVPGRIATDGPHDRSLDGYWPSPWSGEDGGPRRTQRPMRAVGDAGRGLDLQPGEQLVAHQRAAFAFTMPVLRDPGEVFVQGHTMGTADTTSWVERIEPETLETLDRSPDLPGGPFWAGGMAAHANGSLYVTYGRWCHRLGPDCSVIASRELPRDRPYNSLVILPDGHLVMKDFAGGTGQNALLPEFSGSELVVLEPEGLEVVDRVELAEGSIARLSAWADDDACPDGEVYVVGDHHAMRLWWDEGTQRLTLDDDWSVDYRRFDGQTFGWDVVLDGDSAWFLDNGEGTNNFGPSFRGKGGASTSPLHLVRVPLGRRETSSNSGSGPAVEPSFLDVCPEPGGLIANPPAIDAERHIAVGYDTGNSVLRAWRFGDLDPETGTAPDAEPLWQRRQDHGGHLINYTDTGELVTYDYDHEAGTDQVVVLDIETGDEKGRVATGSPIQSVLFPSVGWGRDLYATTFTTLARISVT